MSSTVTTRKKTIAHFFNLFPRIVAEMNLNLLEKGRFNGSNPNFTDNGEANLAGNTMYICIIKALPLPVPMESVDPLEQNIQLGDTPENNENAAELAEKIRDYLANRPDEDMEAFVAQLLNQFDEYPLSDIDDDEEDDEYDEYGQDEVRDWN